MELKTAEPVYIISEEEESEEDNSGVRESESQSESQLDSDYFEKPTFAHRKSVSFDLSGDERGRSEHERSHTPESSSQYYDSEQEFSSKKLPRKGILRASSPSSSNTSTLETKTTTLPIMSTVARIKEIESPVHYSRSPSPARSRSRSPPPAKITEKVPDTAEIEQENPFRAAFLDKTKKDDYTEMAKVISRSPNLLKNARQQFFSSKSSDNLQQEVVRKEHENMSKSVEKLTTSDRPKVKPPPPPKPKNIKKANILQNLALDTFQKTDMGQADYTVYEHDAAANVIHEVGSRSTTPVPNTPNTNIPSPKLPVRILTRTISRPRESPPLPPVNFETLPNKKEESQVEYLEILPPLPPPPPTLLHVKPAEAHEENSTDKILLTEEEHRDLMLSENELRNQLKENIYDETPPLPQRAISKHSPLQLDATTAAAAAPFLATQIFPSAQILPVQYTHLPQLQQSYTNISNLSLGSYVLVPQAQFPSIPNATSQQLTQQTLRQQQLLNSSNVSNSAKSVSDKKRFFESAMEDQHKPPSKTDKIFTFLSKDEVENLKQEEERKIATLRHDKISVDNVKGTTDKVVSPTSENDNSDDEQEEEEDENVDINDTTLDGLLRSTLLVRESCNADISTTNEKGRPNDKPSLLPKPKIKSVLPPALLKLTHSDIELNEQSNSGTQSPTISSRIPVRTPNVDKRSESDAAIIQAAQATMQNALKTKAMINAEKRSSWRAARLRSLEQADVEAESANKDLPPTSKEVKRSS